jgi:hypothetical protein
MGNFNLIIQQPNPQNPINGVLCIDKHGEAQFFKGDGEVGSLAAQMERIRIEHASSKGILLSGIERVNGKIRFQEWWLMYA